MPLQLFADLGPILLNYKKSNIFERQTILIKALVSIKELPTEVTNTEEAIAIYTKLSYVATLINYADVLKRMENQDYFDVLVDFYNMPMEDEFTQLKSYFEFGKPNQMKLKCPIADITPNVWKLFRTAQQAHLKAHNKSYLFDLNQLDINNPPEDQLYPIQIQMGGKLHNEAVDRICANSEGQYRFAKRHGFYLLPGGGMVELSDSGKIEALMLKMLEEHLEEEHANLYIKAAPLYDQLDKKEFDNVVTTILSSKTAQSLNQHFYIYLKNEATSVNQNSLRLKNIINEINLAIALALSEGKANEHKALLQLRAMFQVQTFKKTPLFAKALKHIQQNTKAVDVQQYLDTRVLGGSQMSHSFLMTGKPLEDWFKDQFNGAEGEFGDDIAGSEIERLTLLQALSKFKTIKFSHVLIVLANQIECLNNATLTLQHTWSNEQYEEARKSLEAGVKELLQTEEKLWDNADKELKQAISDLTSEKQKKIITQIDKLKVLVSDPQSTEQEKIDAYKAFTNRCREIIDGKHANILKTILSITAAIVATAIITTFWFGVGFVIGIWTGPGAFFTALMAGSVAAICAIASSGIGGMLTGALVGQGLFARKESKEVIAVENYAKNLQEYEHAV